MSVPIVSGPQSTRPQRAIKPGEALLSDVLASDLVERLNVIHRDAESIDWPNPQRPTIGSFR